MKSGLSIESQLEFVVVEGGGQDTKHPLRWTHISLGRVEAGDESKPDRVGFPEPTVSRNHAELEWNSRKLSYTLNHLSKTNPTLVNGVTVTGSRVLQAGDEIRMGRLLIRLRDVGVTKALEIVDSGFRLLVLSGPEKGTPFKIPRGRSTLQNPKAGTAESGQIYVAGLLGNVVELQEHNGKFEVGAVELTSSLKVYNAWPGLIQECPVSVGTFQPLREDSLVVGGLVSFLVVPEAEAQMRRAELMANKTVHAALAHLPQLTPGGPSMVFQAPEEHTLRALSGPLRTHKLWITPESLSGPIHFGRHPEAVLPLDEEPQAEISWSDRGLMLTNVDEHRLIGLNWEELGPGSGRRLCSGDRFKLGSSGFVYEFQPIQQHLDRLALRHDDEDIPFTRAIGVLGSDSVADFFINSDKLAGRHGRIHVDSSGTVFYEHLDASCMAQVNGADLRAGEEEEIKLNESAVIAPGVVVKVVRR